MILPAMLVPQNRSRKSSDSKSDNFQCNNKEHRNVGEPLILRVQVMGAYNFIIKSV